MQTDLKGLERTIEGIERTFNLTRPFRAGARDTVVCLGAPFDEGEPITAVFYRRTDVEMPMSTPEGGFRFPGIVSAGTQEETPKISDAAKQKLVGRIAAKTGRRVEVF